MVEPTGLVVEELTVQFGGVLAVDGVDLRAPAAQITSLIGPNGAGKTTTFNACTGLLRPSLGRVRIDGTDVTAWSPQQRAQHGLGRTFQRMELFDSLTVRENVALGREALLSGDRPWTHLVCTARDAELIATCTADALALCGIEPLADRPVRDLSTGERRLVELARAAAGGFSLLLLDEPSSGLDHTETEAFGHILTRLVAERGTGILLVEHDMALVMSVSAHVFVLDFGRLIFEGTPAEAQASAEVRHAYLGQTA
jgi:ABC-type branched-subunit amino acid transport system ATPase component